MGRSSLSDWEKVQLGAADLKLTTQLMAHVAVNSRQFSVLGGCAVVLEGLFLLWLCLLDSFRRRSLPMAINSDIFPRLSLRL